MWSKVGIGGEHHRYYKHTKFRQNPRGDPKFLVDLTRNDPYKYALFCLICHGLNICTTQIRSPIYTSVVILI